MVHHTRIRIDTRAYEQNLRRIASQLSPGCLLCAVLKADAYGHGLEFLAPIADRMGAGAIAIAENREAQTIRELGIQCRLLRLRPSLPDEVRESLPWNVEEIVGSLEQAQSLSRLGDGCRVKIPVHLAVDVGIGRMDFPISFQETDIEKVCRLGGIEVCGVMAHFPCADEEDISITLSQFQRFCDCYNRLRSLLPGRIILHIANSAATFRLPDVHLGMTRVGIASYGLSPTTSVHLQTELQPVMSIVTQVVQVRNMPQGSTIGYGMTYRLARDGRIATLPIGYANGYLRDFSNKACVLIHGKRCPVVGRVSMNVITVDVTDLEWVQSGDEAVILGSQGNETIAAEELAGWAQTINYEITCLFGSMNRDWRISCNSAE